MLKGNKAMDDNDTYYSENGTDYYENYTGAEICDPGYSDKLTIMVFQVPVSIFAFVFGVIGNTLVIATFTKYRCLRMRCMTDVFLFNLAVVDLMLLLSLPMEITEAIFGSWVFGNELCKLNYGFCAINTYGGLLLLACISIDRYLLVVRARTAQALRSSMLCYSKLSAVGVALVSIVLSLPELWFTSVNELPYAIVLSIRMFQSNYSCTLWFDIHLAEDITRSLAYIRCCLNPLLYALVGIRFRGDVMKLLRDCGCLCPCLVHVVLKQRCESSMTPSSALPTSTVGPFSDISLPKSLPDMPKIENPAD
ncbi:chemokine (C-C motif) receptor 10 [Silurus meridionalis]|nr:chemokine (C-C motif) receptor 10 [Silurus meridionalis]